MKERKEMSPRRGSALLHSGNGRKEGGREGERETTAQQLRRAIVQRQRTKE